MESILRNKRMLLVYHERRMRLICEKYEHFKVLKLVCFLNDSEKKFLNAIDDIMNKYFKDIGLDLRETKLPSNNNLVQVIVNSNIGEVFFPSVGTTKLEKN